MDKFYNWNDLKIENSTSLTNHYNYLLSICYKDTSSSEHLAFGSFNTLINYDTEIGLYLFSCMSVDPGVKIWTDNSFFWSEGYSFTAIIY